MSVILVVEIMMTHNRASLENNLARGKTNHLPIVYTRFDRFARGLVRSLAPSMVVAPLFSNRFDCIDVGRHLQSQEYAGHFAIMAQNLPNRFMVERELVRHFPKLDIQVISGEFGHFGAMPEQRQALA